MNEIFTENLKKFRLAKSLTQEQVADKLNVNSQTVSCWEFVETTLNTKTLKLLSKLFNVSIITLLGSPRKLICQCCSMTLEDSNISKETDGVFNEEYCKWYYADGEYTYDNTDELIDFCAVHIANENFTSEQCGHIRKICFRNLTTKKIFRTRR